MKLSSILFGSISTSQAGGVKGEVPLSNIIDNSKKMAEVAVMLKSFMQKGDKKFKKGGDSDED